MSNPWVTGSIYQHLWERYLKLFQENTRLIALLTEKGIKMDVTQTPGLVPEDPISDQMATAHLEADKVLKESGTPTEERPVEVRSRFVQTEEMITGTPVVM